MTTLNSPTRPLQRSLYRTASLLLLLASGVLHAQVNKPWMVSGRVVHKGRIVSEAEVRASGPERIASVKTSSEGQFSLTGLKAGIFTFRVVSKSGQNASTPVPIRVSPGGDIRDLVLRLAEPTSISGTVRNTDGRAVSGMVVQAYTTRGSELITHGSDRTDDAGSFRIDGLPEDRYLIAARPGTVLRPTKASKRSSEAETSYPAISFYPGGTSVQSAEAIRTSSGGEFFGADLVMSKSPTYCLTFEIPAQELPEDKTAEIFVRLVPEGEATETIPTAEGKVSTDETYKICGIPRGLYTLHSYSSRRRPFRELGYGRTEISITDSDFTLPAISFSRPALLSGRVSWDQASTSPPDPIADIGVRLIPLGRPLAPSDLQTADIDESGQIHGRMIYPGHAYRLEIASLPTGAYVKSARQGGRRVQFDGAILTEEPLEIILGRDGGTLSGAVEFREGEQQSDSMVILRSAAFAYPRSTRIDQDGRFLFEEGIAPGRYEVIAVHGLLPSDLNNITAVAAVAKGWKELDVGPQQYKTVALKPVLLKTP
jgi:hypothetical protein